MTRLLSRLGRTFTLAALFTAPFAAADEAIPPPQAGAEPPVLAQRAGTIADETPVEMPVIEVIGTADRQKKLPGSAQVLTRETLQLSHVMTTNEALRKAAGVNVRDEEGFGLRPNIGIRGLNPTRSTKVLLLEDGIPLAFAPYGDNASYYHPPVDRFDRIEILKGAGQNIYGPQTVGGVINYITPAPPAEIGGAVRLTGGNREYVNAHGAVGGRGMLLDYLRKQGDGARDNIHSSIDDLNFKAVFGGGAHAFTARANGYREDSQVAYTGLTDAEYARQGARYNPFENDEFETNRQGASLTHEWALGSSSAAITNVYASRFERNWWRQVSTTPNPANLPAEPCGAAFAQDRLDGDRVDPDACAANIGNLRTYYSYGIEPRLRTSHDAFGIPSELETGVRAHFETQDRIGKTGAAADARDGVIDREDNERRNQAYSAFVQNRFTLGTVDVTPALRVEHVRYERTNRLNGRSGEADITEWIPSLGATWSPGPAATLFAGVHRGFAPPGTADLITNSGGTVDLEAEESWNYELGARFAPHSGVRLEATAFLNDFKRQIAVGSIAAGGVPLATGETRYEGAELLARADLGRVLESEHNPFLELAYTWLPTAEQETPFRRVDTAAVVPGSAAGLRLPYAPEHLVTASVGYGHFSGFEARLEAVHLGSQYADFANTAAPDGTGQKGEIAGHTVYNAAVNYRVPGTGLAVFVTSKNLLDKVYIADRTRGILPGAPRLVQAGVEYSF